MLVRMINFYYYLYVSRWLKKSEDIKKASNEPTAQKDFSLKEGQTITLNIGVSLTLACLHYMILCIEVCLYYCLT